MTNIYSKEIVGMLCIHSLVWFLQSQGQEGQGQEGQERGKVLLNSSSEVNVMSPAYVKKLGLHIQKTNIGATNIDGSALEIFRMVIANF